CDALVPNGVAGYVDQVARFFVAQQKADDIAGNRLDADRAMARRRCGDMESGAAGSVYFNRLPRYQAARFSAQPLRTDTRGQYRWHVGEQRAPGGGEIVSVLVIAQQNPFDSAKLRDRQRGTGSLLKCYGS